MFYRSPKLSSSYCTSDVAIFTRESKRERLFRLSQNSGKQKKSRDNMVGGGGPFPYFDKHSRLLKAERDQYSFWGGRVSSLGAQRKLHTSPAAAVGAGAASTLCPRACTLPFVDDMLMLDAPPHRYQTPTFASKISSLIK